MEYNLVPVNDLLLIKIPQDWNFQNGEKFKSINTDNTVRLTISCYSSQDVENAEANFERTSATYFATFDKHYTPVSDLIKEKTAQRKLYNTGKTLEYHAVRYVQPMMTGYLIVCFVFTSIRDLENTDIEIFETITNSLAYKVSDLPK